MDNQDITMQKPSPIYKKNVKIFLYIGTVLAGIVAVLASFGSDAIASCYGRELAIIVTIAGIMFSLVAIGGAIISCIATGVEQRGGKVTLCGIDKIWIEVLAMAGIIIASIWYSVFSKNYYEVIWWYTNPDAIKEIDIDIFRMLIRIITEFTVLAVGLMTATLSVARQIKANNGNYISTTFFKGKIDEFLSFMKSLFDETLYKNNPFRKKMRVRERILILGVLGLIGLSIFTYWSYLIPLICAVTIVFLCIWFIDKQKKMMDDTEKLVIQIAEISAGNLQCSANIDPLSPMFETSQRIRSIQNGFQRSVDEQIKSERMKIELVTNVSHDIKTPLTSIITYIELLSKDETLSPESRDYVNILSQKSERLKNIVADLFTLAKVTSGNEDIDGEVLDMTKLVMQTLGDMGDKIEQSGFNIKAAIPQEPTLIWGDGKKLYRVLQNVIDNALKYAMPGTRIFIDLLAENENSVLTIKNIAAYEMDFTAEQILERFARGDKSRTSDGNGLGLSIAKGFTEACGGTFTISLDGDQFKVTITLPISDMPIATESGEVIELHDDTDPTKAAEQASEQAAEQAAPSTYKAPQRQPENNPPVVDQSVLQQPVTQPSYVQFMPSADYRVQWNYLQPKVKRK